MARHLRGHSQRLLNHAGFQEEQTGAFGPEAYMRGGTLRGRTTRFGSGGFEPTVTHALSLAGVVDLHRGWELHLSNDAVSEFLGGSPAEVPDHYREASPAQKHITAMQKLVHGTRDDSVPYEISKNYAEQKKAAGEKLELITLPDAGHFETMDPKSNVWSKVQDAILALTRR